MIELNEEMTWNDVIGQFDADKDFLILLKEHPRRTRKHLRANGEKEERNVLRLTVQREYKQFTRTLLKKNIRNFGEDFLNEKIGKVSNTINHAVSI